MYNKNWRKPRLNNGNLKLKQKALAIFDQGFFIEDPFNFHPQPI